MKFLRQVGVEIKNIITSKFLMIIGILVLLLSIAAPLIGLFSTNSRDVYYPGGPGTVVYEATSIEYGYEGGHYVDEGYGGQEPITVDGVTITPDNPFYWNFTSLESERENLESGGGYLSTPEAENLMLDMLDIETQYYLRFAKTVTTHDDYRMNLSWNGITKLYDKFIYEHEDADKEALIEVMQYRMGFDQEYFDEKYVNIAPEKKLAAIDEAEDYINRIYDVVDNDNFAEYIEIQVEQQQEQIASMEEQIDILEQDIIDHPQQEENLSRQIEDMRKQIEYFNTSSIPMLYYRLEKNIIPGLDIWQNRAIADIENARSWLQYNEIVSEEEFNSTQYQYLVEEYKTYYRYQAEMQTQIDDRNSTILIAQKCMDADKPDMKYVPGGSRNITVQFLDYSIIVALFAVLLGGWIMGSEFQLGTIRLLLIRPKTRTKILMSKFLAALAVSLAIYIVGSLLNIIMNGICYGFSDFGFPNYNVAGEIGFFAYYIPKLIACCITILFAYCIAFMLSMLVKNIAVSIAVPIACYIGCFISMSTLAYARAMDWIAYTPVPYVQISSFYKQYSPASRMLDRGIPLSLTYGIIMLLVLSAVCIMVSILTFRKRDITH